MIEQFFIWIHSIGATPYVMMAIITLYMLFSAYIGALFFRWVWNEATPIKMFSVMALLGVSTFALVYFSADSFEWLRVMTNNGGM